MARRPLDNLNKLQPKEEVFAQEYASGATRTEAEKIAGYTQGTATKLLRRAAVLHRIMVLQRPYTVTWQRLLVKAQHALDDHLDSANEMAAVLLRRLAEGGQITPLELKDFLKRVKVSTADRNTAARLVMETMGKINPKSLSDAAVQEDEGMSKQEAITALMGADPEAEEAPEPEDADEDGVTH